MYSPETREEPVIELGKASVETKGAVGIYFDTSGGQLRNAPDGLDR